MNKVVAVALAIYGVSIFKLPAYEHVSDYSFVGLSSCTNYPGYSYCTAHIQKRHGELYNGTVLMSVLCNLELSALRGDRMHYRKELHRLRHLLSFLALDNNYGPLERQDACREICYLFLRLEQDSRQECFLEEILAGIKTLFPPDFFIGEKSYQTQRHRTLLKMVFLAGRIIQYFRDNHGCYPPDLKSLAADENDMRDAWGRIFEYELQGTVWQLYSRGPRNEANLYDFDSYVPALELGLGTVDTLGVCLSQSFTLRRKHLFSYRSIESWSKGKRKILFLDSRNRLHDSQMAVRRMEGIYAKAPRLQLSKEHCIKIAEAIFEERFGDTIDACKALNVTETSHSFIVQSVPGKGVGKSIILEIGKDDGAIIRCMQEPIIR